MKNKLSLGIFGSLGFFSLFFLTPATFAIGIQPIRYEVEVKPGETAEGSVSIVNETEKDIYAQPHLEFFYKNDENGFPIFATPESKEVEDINSWIELSKEPVLVKAKEAKKVEYKIKVPLNAEPGGKYIAIGYEPVQENDEFVTVNVRVASLLLLNVAGDINRTGELTDFSLTESPDTQTPFAFNIAFKNTGNTHLKPNGKIEIVDLATGEKVKGLAEYIDPESGASVIADFIPVNFNKTNVFPDSIRIYKGEWTQNLKSGKFKASLNLDYAPKTPSIQKTIEFEINEKLALESFTLSPQEGASSFDLKVKNEGLGNQKLWGSILIENSFGYQMDEIELPKDIESIQAGESKTYNIKWLERSIPEGRYTAKLVAKYGFTQQDLNGEVTFGELDKVKIIMAIGLGLMIIITGVTLFKRKKGAKSK